MQNSADRLYTVSQIREIESIAIQQLQIPGIELMRRAGQAAFVLLQSRWPHAKQLSVLCGMGNNGGDGYVLAKLGLQAGYSVTAYSIADVAQLKGDALLSYQDYVAAGGVVQPFSAQVCFPVSGVIVDALLGTGLNRQVSDDYVLAIAAMNADSSPVLAIDVPSGIQSDTGCVLGRAVHAEATITFIALKAGLFTGEANDYAGKVVCDDLAVPTTVLANVVPLAYLLQKLALAKRSRIAHKGCFGHVLLIGGNLGYSGAIRLAAEAALRSGAGLVSIASRAAHAGLLNITRPELMCHGVETTEQLQVLLDKASVVVIGPGLGQDEWSRLVFKTALTVDKPLVVDADALNLLAEQPVKRNHWVLTPHPGEAARLLARSTQDIALDRYAAVQKLQADYAGVVLLKGAGSLIADGQQIFVGTTGNPGMASGGMGDVLSGIIGGLLAQQLSLTSATQLAVYVHGEAADKVAVKQGERGMLAGDVIHALRSCLNDTTSPPSGNIYDDG